MSTAIFWDVQHGHATTVISPNGRVFVVDLGQRKLESGRVISPLAALYDDGYRRIDHLIISHPHLDHIDDILRVQLFEVRALTLPRHLKWSEISNGISGDDRTKLEYYWSLRQQFVDPVTAWDDATNPANFGGLSVQAFTPLTCPKSNLNNHSIVTVFEEAGVKVVVPGDNEACSLNELLARPHFRTAVANADILLAPHHGRNAGTHPEFLKLVNPKLCVISDGRATGTNAVSVYSRFARGEEVRWSSGGSRFRKCLSTRNDGPICVKFGQGAAGPLLDIEIW